MKVSSDKTALILTGGGARAAYQVGVLGAIRELLPKPAGNPFPIICGTSAGAINAAALACFAEDFGRGVGYLQDTWRNFHADHVYRADALGIGLSGLNWLSALMFGWLFRHSPRSLLDNTPLRRLLERNLDFGRIDAAIRSGALYAVSITASGYQSGHSISFFQADEAAETWKRTHRAGARTRIGVDHLLASSAIPFIFPAIKIHREYFGDGSMRQLAPVSPAIHLGAERILVIGSGRIEDEKRSKRGDTYPPLAQIAGHALSSIFLDSLHVDLERLQRINNTVSIIPPELREKSGLALRRIETLVISPSQRLDYMAARHVKSLPWPVRALLRGIGATNKNGSALASYLLFEQSYTRALMELGYTDTMTRRQEVLAFLGIAEAISTQVT
jgi:NTE family protein